jgi:hypothetical protein
LLTEEQIKQLIEEDVVSEKKRKAKEGQRYYDETDIPIESSYNDDLQEPIKNSASSEHVQS